MQTTHHYPDLSLFFELFEINDNHATPSDRLLYVINHYRKYLSEIKGIHDPCDAPEEEGITSDFELLDWLQELRGLTEEMMQPSGDSIFIKGQSKLMLNVEPAQTWIEQTELSTLLLMFRDLRVKLNELITVSNLEEHLKVARILDKWEEIFLLIYDHMEDKC